YLYEADGGADWMARHFFTGGMMPSDDWLLQFQDDLTAEEHWTLPGTHYQRTAEAWLANLDAARETLAGVAPPPADAAGRQRWLTRWRIFFMACAEMFGYRDGREWLISHYRFKRRIQ